MSHLNSGGTDRICLDLFTGLGGFSSAFKESDSWDVVTVDIDERFEPDIHADVMDLRPSNLPEADVILASPPCQAFSKANIGSGEWRDGEPVSDRAQESVALVYHTLGLIHALSPDYWFMENPMGKLRHVLHPPKGTVTYCQYGRDYMKPTDLWGKHPLGMEYKRCNYDDDCHVSNPHEQSPSDTRNAWPGTPEERSMIPPELSKAILSAIEGQGEQTTLGEVAT